MLHPAIYQWTKSNLCRAHALRCMHFGAMCFDFPRRVTQDYPGTGNIFFNKCGTKKHFHFGCCWRIVLSFINTVVFIFTQIQINSSKIITWYLPTNNMWKFHSTAQYATVSICEKEHRCAKHLPMTIILCDIVAITYCYVSLNTLSPLIELHNNVLFCFLSIFLIAKNR